jgi:hypothetical protein
MHKGCARQGGYENSYGTRLITPGYGPVMTHSTFHGMLVLYSIIKFSYYVS